MDVIVVDEQSAVATGTSVVEPGGGCPTRMVAGFHLSFDDPSALAVAMVLTHAVLPKEAWLAERQISLPWPVSGFPIGSKPIMARSFIAKLSSEAQPNTVSG